MSNSQIVVKVCGLLPIDNGVAVFLGNEEKTFSIHIDHSVGSAIHLILSGQKRERPLTHDLMHMFFQAFNIRLEKVLINDIKGETYHARLYLKADNQIQKKIAEIDCRPSDCIALALLSDIPIHIAPKVWSVVADLAPMLEEMKKKIETQSKDKKDSPDIDQES